ncbi:MAG: NB-ARC domain-containing protein, partial [Thermomicrobiales bacterium]
MPRSFSSTPENGADRSPLYLSTREAAAATGVSERAVRRAIAAGALPAVRLPAGYGIAPDDLAALRAETPPDPRPAPQVIAAALTAAPGLPGMRSSFIGRESALEELQGVLADPAERLVTLVGPGGIGKTRLAIAAAAAAPGRFPDGAVFVPLETVSDPALVLPAIAQALGLAEQADQPVASQIHRALRNRHALLLLDNVEHVLQAAPVLGRLLEHAPNVLILATSRGPLRISGERVIPVQPMRRPEGEVTLEAVLASDAGRLFIERAQRQAALPPLDDHAARMVADICERVDGVPLAIELAAAATRIFSLPRLLARLDHRLPHLDHGPRDAPARHAAMRNAIAWSYDLLSPAAQGLFRRLAVFVGGFTLEGAEAMMLAGGHAPPAPEPVTALLGDLLEQSLIQRLDGPDGSERYTVLETIREFGLEQLAEAGETATAQAAHAMYCHDLVQGMLPIASLYGRRAPLERLAWEQGNLRVALLWLQEAEHAPAFIAMAAGLGLAWYPYRAYREGQRWLAHALTLAEAGHAAPLTHARLLIGVSGIHFAQGDYAAVPPLLDAAAALLATQDAPLETALILTLRGAVLNNEEHLAEADVQLQLAMAAAEAIPDPQLRDGMTGRVLSNRAVTARGLEQMDTARELLEAALLCFRRSGSDLAEAVLLLAEGMVAQGGGDVRRALQCWQDGLAALGPQGDPRL